MARQLADQLKKAFAEAGVELPRLKPSLAKTVSLSPSKKIKNGGKSQHSPIGSGLQSHERSKGRGSAFAGKNPPHALENRKRPAAKSVARQASAAEPSQPQLSRSEINVPAPPKLGIEIRLGNEPRVAFAFDETAEVEVDLSRLLSGRACQCAGASGATEERELVVGLDFGTSSTKVVIGDRAAGKAFAVPFSTQTNVLRYLLPCRLYQSGDELSLTGEGEVHRDLKLALAATPQDQACRTRVAAFLALVIRLARGWLLTEHEDIYRNIRIVWRLAIGLPVAHQLDSELVGVFKRVAEEAWIASFAKEHSMTTAVVESARARVDGLASGAEAWPDGAEVEVDAVPEIAAQIYGFVNSNSFDRNANNIYLMVDVGAGTVDSSLFHVKPGRGGKWDFEFFTSVVEPHGVMNLHRHRVDWWRTQLGKLGCHTSSALRAVLLGSKFHTDSVSSIPEDVDSYIRGAEINRADLESCPDHGFFMKKVVAQVRGKTFWRTWRDGHLDQGLLSNIPAFYCGGGVRMNFYKRLRSELTNMPGCSWLKANPRRISLPANLEAPGLKPDDYDRLSVAYGLSFMEVGKIVRATPKPKLVFTPGTSYQAHYISKDDL